jgi:hypothetical protein
VIRTDPEGLCPCGSGRKRKDCCGGRIIAFPGTKTGGPNGRSSSVHEPEHAAAPANDSGPPLPSPATDGFDDVDFLGLSPAQMNRILYGRFSENQDILTVEPEAGLCTPEGVPLLGEAALFLRKLKERQPLKSTQKGNLPRAWVQELYFELAARGDEEAQLVAAFHKPTGEDDARTVAKLRHLLTFAGIVKKRSSAFSLTHTGEAILAAENWPSLYSSILVALAEKLAWGWSDGIDDLPLIQAATIFNLYAVKLAAADFVTGDTLATIFLDAFPGIQEDVRGTWAQPHEIVTTAFVRRFLDNFCESMGLVETRGESGWGRHPHREYRQSELFKRCLRWGI